MKRKIIGVTVGTSMKPQAVIDKTEQAKQIETNKQDIATLNTKKLDATALTDAINTALAQAKESGEFNGTAGVFIGNMSAYREAYDAGLIPVGCIVIIDDTSTTAVLGKAVLGQMVLGTI